MQVHRFLRDIRKTIQDFNRQAADSRWWTTARINV